MAKHLEPLFEAMKKNMFIRHSKWACGLYWKNEGHDYYEGIRFYEKYIKLVDEVVRNG